MFLAWMTAFPGSSEAQDFAKNRPEIVESSPSGNPARGKNRTLGKALAIPRPVFEHYGVGLAVKADRVVPRNETRSGTRDGWRRVIQVGFH
jgi:hypothetical protein